MTTTPTTTDTDVNVARSLTDETLAARLHRVLEEPKGWSPSERGAIVGEAARRLCHGRKADTLEVADPIGRALAAAHLAEQAATRSQELARERALAIREACAAPGANQAGVAAALGITRGMVGKILGRLEAGK